MTKDKNPKTRIRKAVPAKRISNIIKPGEMSPLEWQLTLRRQQAQKEDFAILWKSRTAATARTGARAGDWNLRI